MKKLKLNVTNLVATEILSREELKRVLGGTGSGSGSGSAATYSYDCWCTPISSRGGMGSTTVFASSLEVAIAGTTCDSPNTASCCLSNEPV